MKVLEAVSHSDSSSSRRAEILGDGMTGSRLRKLIHKRQNEVENSALRKAYNGAKTVEHLYKEGMHDGLQTCCIDLADVLYSIGQARLGKASVLQESNRHVLIRVQECAECSAGFAGRGCSYLAGYICGALLATGRPRTVEVHEESCGRMTDAECVFLASW